MSIRLYTFFRNEFNLRDRILLFIILCCLLALIIGGLLFLISGSKESGELIIISAQDMAEWTGLILLLMNSTIRQSKYWNYIVGGVLIIFLYIVFMILHLPGAMVLLFLGLILIEFVYTIRFVNQKDTRISGWFKYGWICSWCFTTFGIMIDRISESFLLIPAILFWITLIFFLKEKIKDSRIIKATT